MKIKADKPTTYEKREKIMPAQVVATCNCGLTYTAAEFTALLTPLSAATIKVVLAKDRPAYRLEMRICRSCRSMILRELLR